MQRRQSSRERKRDTRDKIQLGGLIVKAGLRSADRAVILGALLDAARRMSDEKERARLHMIGKDAFAHDAKEYRYVVGPGCVDARNALEPIGD
jgi:hypothetical protein